MSPWWIAASAGCQTSEGIYVSRARITDGHFSTLQGGAMGDQAESHKRSLGQYSFASTARFGDLDPERKPGPGAYKMRDSVVLSTKVKAGTAPFGYSEASLVCDQSCSTVGHPPGRHCGEGAPDDNMGLPD